VFGSKLLQFTTLTFAMFNIPAICERESQNKSVPFEPIRVNGLLLSAVAVERFTTTNPPRALAVILEPLNSAWELLLTTTPWLWLPETIRLAPAVREELLQLRPLPCRLPTADQR